MKNRVMNPGQMLMCAHVCLVGVLIILTSEEASKLRWDHWVFMLVLLIGGWGYIWAAKE